METILSPTSFCPLFNPKISSPQSKPTFLTLTKSSSTICYCLKKGTTQLSVSNKQSFSAPTNWFSHVQRGLAALAISLALSYCPILPTLSAFASEFDVLNERPSQESYVVDDAGVLSRVTKSDLKRLLSDLESRKGCHINVITVRKLTVILFALPHMLISSMHFCIFSPFQRHMKDLG